MDWSIRNESDHPRAGEIGTIYSEPVAILQSLAASLSMPSSVNNLQSVACVIRSAWPGLCKRNGNSHTMMKKRNPSARHDTPAHPNMINYLALIHAVTHPGTRPDPGKYHRSHKSTTSEVCCELSNRASKGRLFGSGNTPNFSWCRIKFKMAVNFRERGCGVSPQRIVFVDGAPENKGVYSRLSEENPSTA